MTSMSEQLAPLATHLDPSRAVGRAILQFEADIVGGITDRVIDHSRRTILNWMEKKVGAPLPHDAWSGMTFALPPDQGQSAEAISSEDPWVWAGRLIDADKHVPGRNWIIEASLFQSSPALRLAVRLSCAARGGLGDFVPAVPGFVHRLIGNPGLLSSKTQIRSGPVFVNEDDDLDRFVEAIEDSERRTPIM